MSATLCRAGTMLVAGFCFALSQTTASQSSCAAVVCGMQKQQVSPAAPAYHDNPPTAPPVPAKGGPSFSPKTPDPPGGHVNYPQLYSPSTQHDARHASPTRQRVSDPDWWSSNIGRDVKGFKDSNAGAVGGEGEKQQQQQQPGVRPRDQFERAVQQKVGRQLKVCRCTGSLPLRKHEQDVAGGAVGQIESTASC